MSGKEKKSTELPPELRKFNWGAFLLTWIWGIGHRVWISLVIPLIFILFWVSGEIIIRVGLYFGDPNVVVPGGIWIFILPLIFLIFYLGIKGNELAWGKNKSDNIEKFMSKEKKWAIAGLIFVIVSIILIPILLVLSVLFTRNMAEDTINRASARSIQSVLVNNYKEKNKYCGDNPKELPCGEYTFVGFEYKMKPLLKEDKKILQTNYSYRCENSNNAEGGGRLVVNSDKYEIIPYNGNCDKPLSDEILTNSQ